MWAPLRSTQKQVEQMDDTPIPRWKGERDVSLLNSKQNRAKRYHKDYDAERMKFLLIDCSTEEL